MTNPFVANSGEASGCGEGRSAWPNPSTVSLFGRKAPFLRPGHPPRRVGRRFGQGWPQATAQRRSGAAARSVLEGSADRRDAQTKGTPGRPTLSQILSGHTGDADVPARRGRRFDGRPGASTLFGGRGRIASWRRCVAG